MPVIAICSYLISTKDVSHSVGLVFFVFLSPFLPLSFLSPASNFPLPLLSMYKRGPFLHVTLYIESPFVKHQPTIYCTLSGIYLMFCIITIITTLLQVLQSNLVMETVGYKEPDNFWIGPRPVGVPFIAVSV